MNLPALILNQCIPNMLRSEHLSKSHYILYILHRGRFGILRPKLQFLSECFPLGLVYRTSTSNWFSSSILFLLFERDSIKYLSIRPTFLCKCAISGATSSLCLHWEHYI